jgi:hypothetical protein
VTTRLKESVMLNPIIAEYINADRTDEAHRHADHARLVREVRIGTRKAHGGRHGSTPGVPSRWRAWGWSLTPRPFRSARLLPR